MTLTFRFLMCHLNMYDCMSMPHCQFTSFMSQWWQCSTFMYFWLHPMELRSIWKRYGHFESALCSVLVDFGVLCDHWNVNLVVGRGYYQNDGQITCIQCHWRVMPRQRMWWIPVDTWSVSRLWLFEQIEIQSIYRCMYGCIPINGDDGSEKAYIIDPMFVIISSTLYAYDCLNGCNDNKLLIHMIIIILLVSQSFTSFSSFCITWPSVWVHVCCAHLFMHWVSGLYLRSWTARRE